MLPGWCATAFDLVLAAFEHVHGDVGLASVGKLYRSLPDFEHIFGGQQPHAVNQCQIRMPEFNRLGVASKLFIFCAV